MRILILGATGMLGHKLMQVLSPNHIVMGTVRKNNSLFSQHPFFSAMNIYGDVRADDMDSVTKALDEFRPEIVINCIGIVKQLPAAQDPLTSIAINALFPHQLARVCRNKNIRMIHISTDCVFSGRTGYYSESDFSDADDLYGRTKFLGEVMYPGCLTLRTSIIGREIESSHGLIEWFLGNERKIISGYKKAVFSGLTTLALSEVITVIIRDFPDINGLFQIASEPISKYDLLMKVKERYCLNIMITPDESVVNNRSLNSEKFQIETNIKIPSWEYMIDQMYRDPTPYSTIRRIHAPQ